MDKIRWVGGPKKFTFRVRNDHFEVVKKDRNYVHVVFEGPQYQYAKIITEKLDKSKGGIKPKLGCVRKSYFVA